jgi:hypothetical protein
MRIQDFYGRSQAIMIRSRKVQLSMMAAESAASTDRTLARKINNATSAAAYVASIGRLQKTKNSYLQSVGVISPKRRSERGSLR